MKENLKKFGFNLIMGLQTLSLVVLSVLMIIFIVIETISMYSSFAGFFAPVTILGHICCIGGFAVMIGIFGLLSLWMLLWTFDIFDKKLY